MKRKKMIAMILAGGQGSRLKQLTEDLAKPAVAFGGKYRIIDFTLTNCSHSGIDTVGVLTQYEPHILNNHIGRGSPWDLDRMDGGVTVLQPHTRKNDEKGWYKGTANAIYQYEFEEKPKEPKSDLASMGIYIFNWEELKKYLEEDEHNPNSDNDFGKNIIPNMLNDGKKLVAYPFEGYWRDVGTIQSFWDAHMDLLSENNELDLFDKNWRINTRQGIYTPSYFETGSKIKNSLIDKGCLVEGDIEHSVIFSGVKIGKNSKIIDSIIMADTEIGDNVTIRKAIIANDVKVADNVVIGDGKEIAVVGEKKVIDK